MRLFFNCIYYAAKNDAIIVYNFLVRPLHRLKYCCTEAQNAVFRICILKMLKLTSMGYVHLS